MIDDRLKFRAWIGKEKALVAFGARYIYFDAINGLSDFIKNNEGFDVIEQCTGLKDKNGKLIYEHDWLKTKDGYYCYVEWFDGFWWAKSLPSEAMGLEDAEFYRECEVVGNIHDNPNSMENEE